MGKMKIVETRDGSADLPTFDGHVRDKQARNDCRKDHLFSTSSHRPSTSTLLSAPTDGRSRSTEELVDYILNKLHRPFAVLLLNVEALLDVVIEKPHGEEIGDVLGEIRKAFVSLRKGLSAHLLEEENILFPLILSGNDRSNVKAVSYDMRRQHIRITAKMKTVVSKTSRLPGTAGTCVGQQALYAMLKELQAKLFHHIHMENTVLYPRVSGQVTGRSESLDHYQ